MRKKILLVGGFIEIIELCNDNNIDIVGIIDSTINPNLTSLNYIGDDKSVSQWSKDYRDYEILITPDLPKIRRRLYEYYRQYKFSFSDLISKEAKISKSASWGIGTVVQYGSNISSEVLLGKFVKVNINANIMHNVVIGDFTTVAPNAVVLGNVIIGKGCYIGANATILPNVAIGDNVIIGAGAVVTKSITESDSIYVGVPARKQK